MPEVRFIVPPELYKQATEFQKLGHFDTVGSAVRSLMGVFLSPSIEAIKRSQQAISTGGISAAPIPTISYGIAAAPTPPAPIPASPPLAPSPVGGFGESLSSLLKS